MSRAAMLPLPRQSFEARRIAQTKANSLSLVRFDCNDYSVPTSYAYHDVTAVGNMDEVRFIANNAVVARHERCWDKEKVFFYPIHYLANMGAADLGLDTSSLTGEMSYVTGLWTPTTATLLILVGVLLGLIIYAIGKGLTVRTTRSFTAGEILPDPEVRFSGVSFYETIRQLPILSTLFKDGEGGVYDVYRLGGRYGLTLVQALRRAHTGVLLVYVSWCVIGLILILAYLFRG